MHYFVFLFILVNDVMLMFILKINNASFKYFILFNISRELKIYMKLKLFKEHVRNILRNITKNAQKLKIDL